MKQCRVSIVPLSLNLRLNIEVSSTSNVVQRVINGCVCVCVL